MRANPAVRSILSLVAFALPAAAAVTLVVRYGVDVPNWDEWLFVPFLEQVARGQASIVDWLAPHNDHVVLVPRLLLAGLAFTFGWNIWFGLAAGLLFAGGAVLALRRLSRAGDPWLLLAGDLATALLLFSLVQVENWLWGMQSAWLLVNLCVAVALVALKPGETPLGGGRIALAAVACLVATLTLAQGSISWLAMLPLVTAGRRRWRDRLVPVLWWLLLTVGAWAVLLVSLRRAEHASTTAAAEHDVWGAVQFFFALLGAPLAPDPHLALALGVLLFLAIVAFGAWSLRTDDWPSALPWCSLAAFGGMVAGATSLSRMGYGLDYALSSRYTTNAVLVWVAAWHLTRLWVQGLSPRTARAVTLALLVGLGTGLFATSRPAIETAGVTRLSRSGAKACLELGDLLEPTRFNDGPMLYLYMHPAGARRRFATLVEMGVRRARPRPTLDRTGDGRRGVVTSLSHAGAWSAANGTMSGWTLVEDRDNPPILLLSANDGGSFIAAQPLVEGLSPVGARVHFRTPTVAEWEVSLEASGPRTDAGPISAWRFDPGPNVISRLASAAP